MQCFYCMKIDLYRPVYSFIFKVTIMPFIGKLNRQDKQTQWKFTV